MCNRNVDFSRWLTPSSSPGPTDTHYSDVIISAMAYQITGVLILCLTVCSGADQRKHQSSASLAFVRGIHRSPVDSPYKKGPVTPNMFSFDDVIMILHRPRSVRPFRSVTATMETLIIHIFFSHPLQLDYLPVATIGPLYNTFFGKKVLFASI